MGRLLSSFKALSLDCYGTMIDWESGLWQAFQPLLAANGRDDFDRDQTLTQFARLESEQQARTPELRYPDLLTRVHQEFAAEIGFATSDRLDAEFGRSVAAWPPFPDSAEALRRLSKRYQLVVLSNVDREGLRASLDKLGVEFTAVYTAEEIGSYKPDRRNFDYMLERLASDHSIRPTEVLHTAQSLFHDHVPASALGLATAWIDRQGLSQGGSWGATAEVGEHPKVDFVFPSLLAMADAVEAEDPA